MQQDAVAEQSLEKINNILRHHFISLVLRNRLIVTVEVTVRDILDYDRRFIAIVINQNTADSFLRRRESRNWLWGAIERYLPTSELPLQCGNQAIAYHYR
jgi:hypothetical protein